MRVTVKYLACALLISAALGLLSGCTPDGKGVKVDSLRVIQGSGQVALPGEAFGTELVLELADSDGVPIPDQAVRIEIPKGSELVIPASELRTDSGGVVRIPVSAGKVLGDNYLKVIPVGAEKKAKTFRFVTGMEIAGGRQEGVAGSRLDDPVAVRVVDADGSPVVGKPVFFEIVNVPKSGEPPRLSTEVGVTDAAGVAQTRVTLGSATGSCVIGVKPTGPDGTLLTRGVTVEVMGLNLWMLLLNAFAGLAIFVFGMHLMSEGLQKVAGERMKSIIRFFARNRFVALLAGAGVTAVIQSSSATTVMVIGFINAGLLNLSQAVGIILGTNIGTTITAQIVSFDVGAIAMPAIIAGLLLFFIPWKNCRGIGETVLGFGFLFFGMVIMSDELTGIANFPSVTSLFSRFDCTPIGGIMPFGAVMGALMIGLIVTMIIQSSSASTGIIIALGAGGLINLYTAMPLVLGANIGTTVTAQLAAIPANRVAKQAAMAHTLFNVIGTVIMLAFFYVPWGRSGIPVFFHIVDAVTPGDAFSAIAQNVPRHIANAHTLFNVFTAILLLPFVPHLARLCERLIPAKKRKVKFTSLDPYLLENPPIALRQSVLQLRVMVRSSWNLLEKTMNDNIFDGRVDSAKREEWRKREGKIDRMQQEITSYLVQLVQKRLSPEQSEMIPILTHCTNDAERLADYAEGILKESGRLAERKEKLPRKAEKDLRELYALVGRMAAEVISALETAKPEPAAVAQELALEIGKLADRLENSHFDSLRRGDYNVECGVIFLSLVGVLRQVTVRLDNIAARTKSLINYDLEK